MYPKLRTIHLLCGCLALPMLLMYGVSAVQMAHNSWFTMKPVVTEATLSLPAAQTDARALARRLMADRLVSGELASIQPNAGGFQLRIVRPGTVHEVEYTAATGATQIRTSVAGLMGMLNRLHHAAGFWPEYLPLRLWAALVALASLATLALGATGIWMWWLRRQNRFWGVVLISANLAFSLGVLLFLRSTGGS